MTQIRFAKARIFCGFLCADLWHADDTDSLRENVDLCGFFICKLMARGWHGFASRKRGLARIFILILSHFCHPEERRIALVTPQSESPIFVESRVWSFLRQDDKITNIKNLLISALSRSESVSSACKLKLVWLWLSSFDCSGWKYEV